MYSHTVVMAIVMVAVAAGAGWVAPRAAAAASGGGQARGSTAKPGVNPRAEAVNAFNKRLAGYLELRKKAEVGNAGAGGDRRSGEDFGARRRRSGMRSGNCARRRKPGDIFGGGMTPLILEIVRADWKKRPAADRAAILAEMPKPFVPKVNMRYPVGQPLMTFPPNLLKQLHQLPDDLEYRFVGRDLILRDVKANIVVDVIRHALPSARSS